MIIPNIWKNKKCSKPPTRQIMNPCDLEHPNAVQEQNTPGATRKYSSMTSSQGKETKFVLRYMHWDLSRSTFFNRVLFEATLLKWQLRNVRKYVVRILCACDAFCNSSAMPRLLVSECSTSPCPASQQNPLIIVALTISFRKFPCDNSWHQVLQWGCELKPWFRCWIDMLLGWYLDLSCKLWGAFARLWAFQSTNKQIWACHVSLLSEGANAPVTMTLDVPQWGCLAT